MYLAKSMLMHLVAGLMGLILWAPTVAAAAEPLGELPVPGGYISYIRIIIILIVLLGWWAFCAWVDKDTRLIRRLNREMWNGIVLGGGAFG